MTAYFNLVFSVGFSPIQCYYCTFHSASPNDILDHLQKQHSEKEVKIKHFTLCSENGKLSMQMKIYPFNPQYLEKGRFLQYNSTTNKVHLALRYTPNEPDCCPPMKKTCHSEATVLADTANTPSTSEDDLHKQYIENLLPSVLKNIKEAGFMYEYKEFHQMQQKIHFLYRIFLSCFSLSLLNGKAAAQILHSVRVKQSNTFSKQAIDSSMDAG